MEKISQKDIDWLLGLGTEKKLKKNHVSVKSRVKKYGIMILLISALMVILVILPFFVLIRMSVYFYLNQGFLDWTALTGGMAISALLLFLYLFVLLRNVKNNKRLLKYGLYVISTVVFGFSMFSLLYISTMNTKTPEVREFYRSLHPILRIGISSTILADNNLLLTDIGREPFDYDRMGLPVNVSSHHYKQDNGYVHAVDLRTRGHGVVRNALLRFSFEMMGFKTLRHTGTADHLHVELPTQTK